MNKLPTQLRWRDFVQVVQSLGYMEMKSKRGSARSFHNPSRNPQIVTFHQPHGGDTIRQGTLTEYIKKLGLDRDEFMRILKEVS